ncbi:MAG TPA: ABC transporter permease [Cyclobacteriaceae bacterium]|nr:ABC transporter permease [Cyclobacteriaceae bacterium]
MTTIPFLNLGLAFIPVVIVIVITWKWQSNYRTSIYAIFRMLIQLLLIGYVLDYLFEADKSWVVIIVLTVMLFASAWIGLRTIHGVTIKVYVKALLAITVGGVSVLALVTQGVLQLQPWYLPSFVIPLAGMIFATAMNSISLAGERLEAEINRNLSYDEAKVIAFQASLIPTINSLFAVGLVSLPGMMTGQILSGVSPFIAARYQIMVMCMIFGSAGISSALFLSWIRSEFTSGHGTKVRTKSYSD